MTKKHEFHRPDLDDADRIAAYHKIKQDLQRIIPVNGAILDVGANIGQFALEILSILPDIKLYSFEPVPDAYEELKSLSEKHHQVIPIKKAISLQNGQSTFYVTASDVGSSLLEPLPNQKSKWLTLDKKVSVETIRLDAFIKSENLGEGISLLKSDAQGNDLDVILSLGDFLKPNFVKAILVETNFTNFYHGQQNYYDIFSTLDNAGYRMAWMYPHRAHDEWLWCADVLFIGKQS
jgi:FkbM family methyltransferase